MLIMILKFGLLDRRRDNIYHPNEIQRCGVIVSMFWDNANYQNQSWQKRDWTMVQIVVSSANLHVYSGMSQYSEQGSCIDAIYSLHYRVHQQGETFTVQVSRQHISLENKQVAIVTNMNFKSMMSFVVQIIGNPSRQANFFAQHLDNANQQLLGPPSPAVFYDS